MNDVGDRVPVWLVGVVYILDVYMFYPDLVIDQTSLYTHTHIANCNILQYSTSRIRTDQK